MTAARSRRPGRGDPVDRSAPRDWRSGRASGFSLLAETLVAGVVVAVASIPLVTALPAVAAAVRHLRRHLAGGEDSWAALVRDVGVAVRALWWAGAAVVVLLAVLGFNLWLAGTGALPGGVVVGAVSAALAVVVLVVALRTAAGWSGGSTGLEDLRAGAVRGRRDAVGSLLLAMALAACGVLVWMLLPLLLVVGGLLALAGLAVETRHATRSAPPPGD